MDQRLRGIFSAKSQNNSDLLDTIKKRLSGRIKLEDIHEITYLLQNNDEEKQKLYDFVFESDDTIATNTLWIMTHYSLSENEWLYQKQDEMIDRLLSVTHPSQQRLLLHLLYRQPLANPPRVDFLDYCLHEMISRKAAPASTTLCMKLAYEMCRTHPELLQEYCIVLDAMKANELLPSLQVARKNIMKAMQKGKSLQVY